MLASTAKNLGALSQAGPIAMDHLQVIEPLSHVGGKLCKGSFRPVSDHDSPTGAGHRQDVVAVAGQVWARS